MALNNLSAIYSCDQVGVTEIFSSALETVKDNPRIIVPYLILSFVLGGLAVYGIIHGIASVYGMGVFGQSGSSVATGSAANTQMVQLVHGLVPLICLIIIISIFITPLVRGMYISIADQSYKNGRISLGRAFRAAKRRYATLLATMLLIALIWVAVSLVLGAVFLLPIALIGTAFATRAWLFLGLLVLIALMILLSILFYEAYAVVMLENVDAVSAIKRSMSIGRKNLANIFSVFAISAVILALYVIFLTFVAFVFEGGLAAYNQVLTGVAITQLINFVLGSVMGAWFSLIPVGVYRAYVQKDGKRKT